MSETKVLYETAADTAGFTGAKGGAFMNVPLAMIGPWAHNPRKAFENGPLDELAESIRIDGVQQPIVVREADAAHYKLVPGKRSGQEGWFIYDMRFIVGEGASRTYNGPHWFFKSHGEAQANVPVYEIVMGERRWRASQLAGRPTIPAIVHVEMDDKTAMRLAVVENCRRRDLNAIEEANSYAAMERMGYTQKEIADSIGCDQSVVSNRLRLLRLPQAVQDKVMQGQLSASHARALLRFEAFPTLLQVISDQAIAEGVSAKALEKGLPFGSVMASKKLVRQMWSARFDTKVCETCPHGAFLKVDESNRNSNYCLLPEEFDRKNAEREAAIANKSDVVTADAARAIAADVIKKLAEIGTTAEETSRTRTQREADSDADKILNKLPSIRDMPNAATIQGHAPAGCTKDCPCRCLAKNYQGVPAEICTDRDRHYALATQERLEQQRIEAAACQGMLERLERVIEDQDGVFRHRVYVVAAASLISTHFNYDGAAGLIARNEDLPGSLLNILTTWRQKYLAPGELILALSEMKMNAIAAMIARIISDQEKRFSGTFDNAEFLSDGVVSRSQCQGQVSVPGDADASEECQSQVSGECAELTAGDVAAGVAAGTLCASCGVKPVFGMLYCDDCRVPDVGGGEGSVSV